MRILPPVEIVPDLSSADYDGVVVVAHDPDNISDCEAIKSVIKAVIAVDRDFHDTRM